MDFEGRTIFLLHRNQGVIVVHFSGRLACFPRQSYSHLLHRIWAATFGTNFEGIHTARRAQKSRS
jgi:hypothetical protein